MNHNSGEVHDFPIEGDGKQSIEGALVALIENLDSHEDLTFCNNGKYGWLVRVTGLFGKRVDVVADDWGTAVRELASKFQQAEEQ